MKRSALDYTISISGRSLSNDPYHRQYIAHSRMLYRELVHQLASDQIQILRIRDYILPTTRKLLLDFANKSPKQDYLNDVIDPLTGKVTKVSYGVWRVGPALNTIFGSNSPDERKKLHEQYWDQTLDTQWGIEEALQGEGSPVDQLQSDLRNRVGYDTKKPLINGLPAMAGIIRGTEPGKTPMVEKPHVDVIRDETMLSISRQLSAVMFLEVPTNGGELVLWNGPLFNPTTDDESEFIDRTVRNHLAGGLKPEAGDLVMFNTRHPHATTEFCEKDGKRIAITTFVGIHDNEAFLWS